MKIDDVLKINDSLNKKIWSGARGENINEKVSESLIEIAQDFFDGLMQFSNNYTPDKRK